LYLYLSLDHSLFISDNDELKLCDFGLSLLQEHSVGKSLIDYNRSNCSYLTFIFD